MKRLLGLAVVLPFLLVAGTAWAGSVKIVSPQNGATVDASFPLEVKVEQGGGVDHYHLFVDGEFVKAVMDPKFTVGPLASGKHKIKAWGASSAHALLDVSDEIEVTVR
jgi:Bacterial Ig domain